LILILRQIAGLLRLCITGPGGKLGIAFYVAILTIEMVDIVVSLRLIAWNKDFYDALQQLNGTEALRQIGVFGLIVASMVVLSLSSTYLRKLLEMRWRRALTAQVLDRWLGGKAYLRTGGTADGGPLDNPDQRIAEDCRIFLAGPATGHGSGSGIIPMSLDLITRIVALVSYVALLWSLSTFALDLSFIGIDAELPRYMVWAAFIYVALSSGLTHLLGRPLKQLYVAQQRREADYRFALMRLRESRDAVALSGGEPAERQEIDRRFSGIVANWKRMIDRELILSFFTVPYQRTVLRIPTFLALPAYFGGNVTFGGMMQLGSAFSNVVTTLSWVVFSYRSLAELAAATTRLARFVEALEAPPAGEGIVAERAPGAALHVRDLAPATPAGRALFLLPELKVQKGEALWLRGPSGLGKTTFMKALAGVWKDGAGRIGMPGASALFLPQQPYLPIGGVAAAVAYPLPADAFAPSAIESALVEAGFSLARLKEIGDEAVAGLSGGERQRLALARVFLHAPEWVFLDEATSALDREAEMTLFARMRKALPDSSFIVVAHREPAGFGHMRAVDLAANAPGLKPEAA